MVRNVTEKITIKFRKILLVVTCKISKFSNPYRPHPTPGVSTKPPARSMSVCVFECYRYLSIIHVYPVQRKHMVLLTSCLLHNILGCCNVHPHLKAKSHQLELIVNVLTRNSFRFSIFYRPHPKDGEGNVFSLSTLGGVRSESSWGGSGQSPAGGGQVRVQPGGSGQSPAGRGQVRVQPGGSGQSSRGGGVSPAGRGGGSVNGGGGGSASCALLRAVCLLRSRRRTFLFKIYHWNC